MGRANLLTPFDLRMRYKAFVAIWSRANTVDIGEYNVVPFQFPPIIPSDNKGGNWKEISKLQEPIALYMGGQPRTIDLKFTYVADGTWQDSAVQWNTATIASICRVLRGYFYAIAGTTQIIYLKAYDIVGRQYIESAVINDIVDEETKKIIKPGSNGVNGDVYSFRSDSVSISHSDTLVQDDFGIFPLRTDISLKLKFFLNMKTSNEASKSNNDFNSATGNLPKGKLEKGLEKASDTAGIGGGDRRGAAAAENVALNSTSGLRALPSFDWY